MAMTIAERLQALRDDVSHLPNEGTIGDALADIDTIEAYVAKDQKIKEVIADRIRWLLMPGNSTIKEIIAHFTKQVEAEDGKTD